MKIVTAPGCAGSRGAEEGRRGRSRGFTLIELLVVVAIIALLIAILLPALASAKKLAHMVREQASANQHMIAWTAYAEENKGAVFTGYIPWSVGHLNNNPGPMVWLHPDPWNDGYMVEGNVIKVAGLRWMGATAMPLDAHIIDRNFFGDVASRPVTPSATNSGYSPRTTLYDNDTASRAAAAAYHPSLGGNYTYVGGSAYRGAYPNYSRINPVRIGHPREGKFYVTHTHEIQRTANLITFGSARGVDIKSVGGWGGNYGRAPFTWTANSTVVPGFWSLSPPVTPGQVTSSMGITNDMTWPAWVSSDEYRESSNPKDWGQLHPRHNKKAVTAMADGHVEMQGIRELRDMRKWSNYANRSDWTFTFP